MIGIQSQKRNSDIHQFIRAVRWFKREIQFRGPRCEHVILPQLIRSFV
jgi:hypothetical protein